MLHDDVGKKCRAADWCCVIFLQFGYLVGPGAAKSGGDKLWEDNWDDDDIEDDFSVQLRCAYLRIAHTRGITEVHRNELAKKNNGGKGPEPMQH